MNILFQTDLVKIFVVPEFIIADIADFVGFHPIFSVCSKLIERENYFQCQTLCEAFMNQYASSVGILLSHEYAMDDLVKRKILKGSDSFLYNTFGTIPFENLVLD